MGWLQSSFHNQARRDWILMNTEIERLGPIEDLKEVWIGPLDFQITKPESSLSKFGDEELVTL